MPSLVNTDTLVCELPTHDSLFLLTRSDFDDSKKDQKPKPKEGVKVRTVTVIDLVTIAISTCFKTIFKRKK